MSSKMKKILQCGAVVAASACLGATILTVQPNRNLRSAVTVHASSKRARHAHHTKSAYNKRISYIYKMFRQYHLNRKYAAVLTGVAMHEAPNLRSTTHERGGEGYGVFQVNKSTLRRWCRHHHMSYKTLRGQVAQFYNCFVKDSGFRKSKGSILHDAKVAEIKIMRVAMPATNRIASYSRKVLQVTK